MSLQQVLPKIRSTVLGYLTAGMGSVVVRDGLCSVDDAPDNEIRSAALATGIVLLLIEPAQGLAPGGEVYQQLPDYQYRVVCMGRDGVAVETLIGQVLDAIGVRENLDLTTAGGDAIHIGRLYPSGWGGDEADGAIHVARNDVYVNVEGVRMEMGIGG